VEGKREGNLLLAKWIDMAKLEKKNQRGWRGRAPRRLVQWRKYLRRPGGVGKVNDLGAAQVLKLVVPMIKK